MSQQIKKIIAVIITYRPDLELLYKNFQAMASQVAQVILIDNSDDSQHGQQIQARFKDHPELVYISNGGNQGIAHALNRGVEYAERTGADWILTMDQDSVLPENYVATLSEVITTGGDRVASIGTPFQSGGRIFAETENGGEVQHLITSGNLINTEAVIKAGKFRDEFFIDYVDIELSFRLRKLGYKLIETQKILFTHHLGEPVRRTLFGIPFTCTNHSALRCYYMSRNRMVFFYENFLFDPKFVFRCFRDMIKEMIKIIIAEDHKQAKLKAIFVGIKDGILGHMGKYQGKF
ncbi:glycosyltransferase family 2 protein [Undibacterium sp. SXout11W]|uniref:glycosyltransferase family 2 protein n=1 Tax=Undibacterium sp. SXout11W TaxID=3413050 RepID=UPI003BF1ACA4